MNDSTVSSTLKEEAWKQKTVESYCSESAANALGEAISSITFNESAWLVILNAIPGSPVKQTEELQVPFETHVTRLHWLVAEAAQEMEMHTGAVHSVIETIEDLPTIGLVAIIAVVDRFWRGQWVGLTFPGILEKIGVNLNPSNHRRLRGEKFWQDWSDDRAPDVLIVSEHP